MADRKVLVKYYPPDFDPDKLAEKGRQYRNYGYRKRRPGGGGKLMNVRFMFPFTMCCGMCNEFIYIGTKFNSRVEKIRGEDYLGIPIWRFFARCPHCRGEITFKTDPKNTEYILESGGTRTYDPRKDADLAESTLKERLEEEIATDSMKALEHKTHSTANELQALEQLDELRKINKRLLSREATLAHALEWLKGSGVKVSPDELNEAELEEFRQAKEEMDALRLQKALGEHSSDDDEDDKEDWDVADDVGGKSNNDRLPQEEGGTSTPAEEQGKTREGGPAAPPRMVIKKRRKNDHPAASLSALSGYDSDNTAS